jgi:methylglutaconyl-CoA hydratase
MSEVLIKKENFYYTVKLNRPEKHNAFTPSMIKELTHFFRSAENDKFAGAIILTGSGHSFCAGGDLDWMKSSVNMTYDENLQDANALFDLFDSAQKCSLPIVGYMHGNVFGGGLGLAAICDIAISEFSTRYCFSEVKLGLVPAVISSFVLNKMNNNRARHLMISAKIFDASTAFDSGLVEFVGRELDAQDYLKETIQQISRNGPEALRHLKKLLLQMRPWVSPQVRALSTQVIAERRASDEGQEGIKSFLEKRSPAWMWPQTVEDEK